MQDEEFDYQTIEDEIEDINRDLTSRDYSQKEGSYVTKYAYEEIEKELLQHQDEHQFSLDNNKKPFFTHQHNTHIYEISRVAKLRFKCKNNRCPYFADSERQKRWTSYWGFIIFSFYFQHQSKRQRKTSPPIIRHNLKIFGQKCLTCKEWGSGSILATDMKLLSRLYYLIFQIVLYEKLKLGKGRELTTKVYLRPEELKGMRRKSTNRKKGGRHMSELCEACERGKCPFLKKKKEK